MYKSFKSVLHFLLPRKMLFKNEPFFRKILYFFYAGNQFYCNICQKGLRKFIKDKNENTLCPNCGSLPRNRRLWHLLETEFLKPGMHVLDFSPSRCLYRKLKENPSINYISTDLSTDFIAEKQYDITQISEPNNQFDLIICYHILEHVINDVGAMKELFRVVNPNGIVLVQTPFKEGAVYENYQITTKEGRLDHFGQADHVRIYSVSGLKERLEKCGFKVAIRTDFQDNKSNGFDAKETILVLTKKS
jgi:SAM-dependent methyltransferase